MVERHAILSRRIIATVTQRIHGVSEQGIKPLDPNSLDAPDLARLQQVAAALERLSRGASTERVETSGTVIHEVPDDLAEQAENWRWRLLAAASNGRPRRNCER